MYALRSPDVPFLRIAYNGNVYMEQKQEAPTVKKRWFISDTHFGHANVIKYSQRPFLSKEEMDKAMVERWNKVVSAGDDVYFLGDFGLAGVGYLTRICHSLAGRKILIRGNHDGSIRKMERIGFDLVLERASIRIADQSVVMSHYPQCCDVLSIPGDLNLYGHVHEKGSRAFGMQRGLCVCVELWDYTPVSEKQIESEIKKWKRLFAI